MKFAVTAFRHQYHTLRFNAPHLPWCKVNDHHNLFANNFFGCIVHCDSRYNGALLKTKVDLKFQQFIGFLDFFRTNDRAYTKIEFRKIIINDFRFNRGRACAFGDWRIPDLSAEALRIRIADHLWYLRTCPPKL